MDELVAQLAADGGGQMFMLPPEMVFPELLLFEEHSDRFRALTRARRANHFGWFWAFAIILGFCLLNLTFFTFNAIAPVVMPTHALRQAVLMCFGPILVTSVTAFVANWTWRRRIRRSLRAQLQERGVPICVRCGYDLRGQHEPRCPECGEAFDPALLEQAAHAGKEAKPSE